MAVHRGTLVVDGDAVHRPNAPTDERKAKPREGSNTASHVGSSGTSHAESSASHVGSKTVAASRLDDAIARTQARDALVGLGWKPYIARTAVGEALSALDPDSPLEVLIREALRRCPRPGG